jgi:membrane protease YdiL (CAAX protease family)
MVEPSSEGRLLDHKAVVLVAVAIGLGVINQLVAFALVHLTSLDNAALIRYDLVLTLGLYAVVAVLIVSQISPAVRLRWGDGSLASRAGFGAAVGVGISLVLLALVSAASGHLQSDPRVVLLMSEGDAAHILVVVLIACVAAPLVEETLFRGLLLESLRPRGVSVAVLVSAAAFAVWHLMPASLVYYTALGAALGGLYLKRGLACSVAAHVGFNGVLTIAAIVMVLGPSHAVHVGDLSVTVPSGWHVQSSSSAAVGTTEVSGVSLTGPSAAELEIIAGPPVPAESGDAIASILRNGNLPLPPNVTVDPSSVEEIPTSAGQAVEVSLTSLGQPAKLALLAANGRSYELVLAAEGSSKANADFTAMVRSMTLS